MGQYHVLVNLDKKEIVSPHGLGLGLKQWEHLGEFNGTLADAMYLLVMTSPNRGGGDLPSTNISSRWAGDRVLVLGDYTEDSDVASVPNAGLLYTEAYSYTDITDLVAEAFEQVFRIKILGEGWKERVKA
jgi:hypothetical protein